MKRSEYLKSAFEALNAGLISAEAYDAALENIDDFCDDSEDDDAE